MSWLSNLRSRFSVKIFMAVSSLMAFSFVVLIAYYYRHESRDLTRQLTSKGALLADMLAHNVRMGTFAESASLLETPVNSILNAEDVQSVAVYTANQRLIIRRNRDGGHLPAEQLRTRPGRQSAAAAGIRTATCGDHTCYLFTAKVVLPPSSTPEDALYFSQSAAGGSQSIGYVEVVLDDRALRATNVALLWRCILLGLVLVGVSSAGVYLLAMGMTRNLNMLTAGIRAYGEGGHYENSLPTSVDEIGMLTTAFNGLVDDLARKDREKRALEERYRQSLKMEAIGTMAGGVAHDFDNALMAILGYAELLRRQVGGLNKAGRHLEMIVSTAERAAALVKKLLTFSRKQPVGRAVADLHRVIHSVVQMLTDLRVGSQSLRVQLTDGSPVVALGRGELEQILHNLVSNARDAMGDGGLLTISTRTIHASDDLASRLGIAVDHGYILLSIMDTGTGIHPDDCAKVFDPFFTTKELGKGTGLGLSVVYGIVKSHGGGIELESQLGVGSSFHVYLPLTDEEVLPEPAVSMVQPVASRSHILIAEDNRAVNAVMKELLEESGYQVICTLDGQSAVETFAAHRDEIDLVILDILMPGKDGTQCLEEMRTLRPDMKVVFLSAYTGSLMNDQCPTYRGVEILTKPINPNDFLAKIGSLLVGEQAG